ncbi:hypothetical protein [Thermococcus barophilus]|uniref:Uncharacterized protein n=1 Tax=Thermococcus barophilus TaxID=55802 RepID=A0A0S1X8Q8_THEBA|nr:hypothetical protein [Thermococcus barophilus]ALM74153.1 conserved membrane hypothetical protein [Thermococcus barophilus]
MQMVSIIKGLMQGIAVLLIILGVTYVVDYQLNKSNPYFEDPDAVELTLKSSAYFLVVGGVTLFFVKSYRENADSTMLNIIITILLALAMLPGYVIGVLGLIEENSSLCKTYERPEFIVIVGLLLFLLSAITVALIWIWIFASWLKSSK